MDKTNQEQPPAPVSETVDEDDAAAQAAFDEGAAGEVSTTPRPRDDSGRFTAADDKPADKDAAKPSEKPAEQVAAKPADKPEYVQITKEQFAELTTAVAQTKEFEKQFSKVFGTVGDMQKILRGLQSQTPRGAAVKLPPGAFDAMKKDFPELSDHMQTAMEGILKGIEGTGDAEFERKLTDRVLKMAADDLADEFPDWKKIVGAVDTRKDEKPDPNHPFRKWLATKPQDYQDRINHSTSSGVITRAIRMFKSETKVAPPAATPNKQALQRNSRIAEAVTPKGDGGHPPGKSADEEFEAGFQSG